MKKQLLSRFPRIAGLFFASSLLAVSVIGCSPTARSVLPKGNESAWNGSLGSPNAPLTITVFQDLRCGMCGFAYEQHMGVVKARYVDTGLVRYVFREFPLGFNRREVALARGAKCAARQNKYLPFTGYLLINRRSVEPEKLSEYAKLFSLDVPEFNTCVASKDSLKAVRADVKAGKLLGVNGTPTYAFNGEVMAGAMHQADFIKVVEEYLKALGVR